MNPLAKLVDQVIAAFDARRRTRWVATLQPVTVSDPSLKRWRALVEERLETFRTSTIERRALLDRVQKRFKGNEAAADFAMVAEELQQMARDELREHLAKNGVPEKTARSMAEGYSIGALLH